ncbi:RICIN domain-containing protein [Streptomyces griseochromogenes]|uniref:RICIN domain-containing protein n=1 Tax=Streptomyces griseochromogenes TaxID=68214 RepID=UPI0037A769FC
MNLRTTALTTRIARPAAVVFATAAMLLAGTTAAHAVTPTPTAKGPAIANGQTYYYALKNQNTGRCVDDSWDYGLRAFTCNGLNYQNFNWYNQSDGTWVIQNQNTGRCIDDSTAYGLRAFSCNYQSFQRWTIVYQSDGTKTLKNQNTGRVIDDSTDFGLRAFGYNALSYQRFTFVG